MTRPGTRATTVRRALVLVLFAAPPGLAQDGHLSLDAGAAHALPPAGAPGEETSYLLGGIRLAPRLSPPVALFASAHGGLALREGAGDWGSGVLGLASSAGLGSATRLGVTALAEGFSVGGETPYRALTLRLLPEVRRGLGATVLLRLHGAAGIGSSRVAAAPADGEGEEIDTGLWTLGGGVELRHAAGPLELVAGAEGYRAARDADFLSGYVGISLAAGGVVWSAELRGWDTPEGGETVATARLVLPLGGRAEASLAGGRFGPDPLLESPAGVSLAGILSWRAVEFRSGPAPAWRLVEGGRAVRFELTRPGAREVAVAGEFSGWEWRPLEEEAPGRWRLTVPVEPGVYRFGFRVDGEWFAPEAGSRVVEDEWGRRNLLLVVPEP